MNQGEGDIHIPRPRATVTITRPPFVAPPAKIVLELDEEQALQLESFLYSGGKCPVPGDFAILNSIYHPLRSALVAFGGFAHRFIRETTY